MNNYEEKYGKFYLSSFTAKEIQMHLNLTEEEFNKLYVRSFNAAKSNGNYLFYKKNIIGTEEKPESFSSVGFYFYLNMALELKKYQYLSSHLSYVKKIVFNDLLEVYKQASKTPRKKNTNSDIDFEDLMAFKTKKITIAKNDLNLEDVQDKEHKLYNKSIVLTGDFEKFSVRDNFIPLVNKLGCQIKSGVTSKVDFLVCGSNPGPSKVKKAQELNIPTINENEFYTLLNIKL